MLEKPFSAALVNPLWSHARGAPYLSPSSSAGNFTTGVTFNVTRTGIRCIGMRFYVVASAAKTIKCKLYDAAGTLQQTTNVAVSANGVFETYWTTPFALTIFSLYRVCTWQTDGLNYTIYINSAGNMPVRPFPAGGVVIYNSVQQFLAGDAAPTSLAGTETYPCEPILDGTF
jgi:hypothetical protein